MTHIPLGIHWPNFLEKSTSCLCARKNWLSDKTISVKQFAVGIRLMEINTVLLEIF